MAHLRLVADLTPDAGPLDRLMNLAYDAWRADAQGYATVSDRDRFDAIFMMGWTAALNVVGVSPDEALHRMWDTDG